MSRVVLGRHMFGMFRVIDTSSSEHERRGKRRGWGECGPRGSQDVLVVSSRHVVTVVLGGVHSLMITGHTAVQRISYGRRARRVRTIRAREGGRWRGSRARRAVLVVALRNQVLRHVGMCAREPSHAWALHVEDTCVWSSVSVRRHSAPSE